MTAIWTYLACFAASALLTAGVRWYALRTSLLDVPNARSSHVRATPRGGGLAVVAVTGGLIARQQMGGSLSGDRAAALLLGLLIVAAAGWLDDRRGLSAGLRLLVHVSAAVIVVAACGPVESLVLGRRVIAPLGVLAAPISVLWIVGMINVYNFMDGIDGLAGVEGVLVGVIGAALCLRTGAQTFAIPLLGLSGASLGFLVWNWAPARIFLGDVGSGSIGFLFGALALNVDRAGGLPLLGWCVLLGVFVFDASATLVRRMLCGEAWYSAHRDHAYQRATRHLGSHARTCLAVIALNAGLGALAWLMSARPVAAPWTLSAAIGLLAVAFVAVERKAPFVPAAMRTHFPLPDDPAS